MGLSPGSPNPHRSRLRRRAAGLSVLLHLLFFALLLWLPLPSSPGTYTMTVRLSLEEPAPLPKEPLPSERLDRERPPESPPKVQAEPPPVPHASPQARAATASPRPSAEGVGARNQGSGQPEGPTPSSGEGVEGLRRGGIREAPEEGVPTPAGMEQERGEAPGTLTLGAEETSPASGVRVERGNEELAPLANANAGPPGEGGTEEGLRPFGRGSPAPQEPSGSGEGLASGPTRVADAGPDPLGEVASPSSSGKGATGSDPLSKDQGADAGPDPLGKGQGRALGQEVGACALVVDVSAFPFTPNPSPALLDPDGNVVWPAEDRVQGIPGRVVEESGIALFFRKGQFSEKDYAQVLHVRATGTRPRAPGSRFHDFALLDPKDAARVRQLPPRCQVVFLY